MKMTVPLISLPLLVTLSAELHASYDIHEDADDDAPPASIIQALSMVLTWI
jgi:hypothetical protein